MFHPIQSSCQEIVFDEEWKMDPFVFLFDKYLTAEFLLYPAILQTQYIGHVEKHFCHLRIVENAML